MSFHYSFIIQTIQKKMQFLNKLQDEYDQLWKYIIRPTRTTYPDSALGPETFVLQNIKVKRNSFQLINDRGLVFYGSHFVPLQAQSYPCVIYLHGNSSNQTEGMQYLGELIKRNISLCTFDFAGCGNSEGQYISLGYYEWKDVEEVYMHIRAKQKITKIGIWGRSMGAVTALRYLYNNHQISAAVFDSPFTSLSRLVTDLCKKNSKIPVLIVSGSLKIISTTIKQKAKFDIYELDPLKNQAPTISIPGFFIVGKDDEMIPADHTKALYAAYKSKRKQIRIVEGEHNTNRPAKTIEEAIQFLHKFLTKSTKAEKQEQKKKKEIHNNEMKKVQEIDFFNQDLIGEQQEIHAKQQTQKIKKELEEVDFFAQNVPSEQKNEGYIDFEREEFDISKFEKAAQESMNSTNETFSFNDFFSGMFSSKGNSQGPNKKSIKFNDGFSQWRIRLNQNKKQSNRLKINISQQAKKQRQKWQKKIAKQLKNYDKSFEKVFINSPMQYVWS